jgi:hypothetical protein
VLMIHFTARHTRGNAAADDWPRKSNRSALAPVSTGGWSHSTSRQRCVAGSGSLLWPRTSCRPSSPRGAMLRASGDLAGDSAQPIEDVAAIHSSTECSMEPHIIRHFSARRRHDAHR